MAEEKVVESNETRDAEAQSQTVIDAARRIPATSVAVMIFILLVAFACTGVTVVNSIIEDKYAPEVIKGKDTYGKPAQYPTLSNDLPLGVAGQVGDVQIPESQITNFILNLREKVGLEDQEAWDQWMIGRNHSTETIRNQIILYYINNEIIEQMADELGIQPTEADYQQTRDEIFDSPEAVEAMEASLAAEGRTFDDFEADIVMQTKKRLITAKVSEGITETPAFKATLLKTIQGEYPEYADTKSLDDVDPAIVEEVSDRMRYLSEEQAFSSYLKEFVDEHDIYYSPIRGEVPYPSNSDAYFAKQEFMATLKQALKKSGMVLDEDTFPGNLFVDETETADSES